METTVYIPTLRAGERLARTLEALERQEPKPRVVVVDNSADGLGEELVRNRFHWAQSVVFGENLGFGAALNRGVREMPGDPIVFLNDDVTVEPGFIAGLTEALAPGVGMVAGVLLSEADPGRIDSAGVVADRTLLGFDYLNGEPVEALESAGDPLGPTGGAALYRRSAFEQVGGFDEGIFLYYEDLDLALRMAARGGRCRLAGGARALHAYSASLGAASAEKFGRTGWSRGYMLRRYGVMSRPGAALRALAAEGAICAGQLLLDRTAGGLRGRVRGWRAAAGLPLREVGGAALLDVPLREALRMRRRRRG